MKQKIVMMVSVVVSIVLLSPAWGQSGVDDPVSATESSGEFRPEMPRLFFSGEQRRVLEAVRQDVIAEESFEEENFVPLILRQEQIDLTPEQQERTDALVFDSFIRNRSTGKGSWWGKEGEERQFSTGKADDLSRQGVVQFEPSTDQSKDGDGAIVGIDRFNKTRFILKVGQQLLPDGEISETYPVVLKKNRN